MEKRSPKANTQDSSSSQNVRQDTEKNEGNMQAIGAGRDANVIQADKVYIGGKQQFEPCESNGIKPSSKIASLIGTIIYEDHKYEGYLAYINLGFTKEESEQTEEIGIRLSITFGIVEEPVKYKSGKEGSIKFGIKYGELRLSLPTGVQIPLHQRGLNQDPENKWQINPVGQNKAPCWQFTVKENSTVLQGRRSDQKLGSFEVLTHPSDVEAVFQVKVNRNNLEITAQDNVWFSNTNKKIKETMIRAFFKQVVEPKLKEYVNKVVLRYD